MKIKAPNIALLVGVIEQATDSQVPKLFNSLALIKNGVWEVVGRKQLLPTYDVFDEKRYFRPAKKTSIIKIETSQKSWSIGLTICEDLWVEEKIQGKRLKGNDPIRQLYGSKIDLLLNLSASPFSYTKESVRQKLAAKAAKQINCPVVYLNQVGGNDELIFDGSSFVVDNHGKIICSLPKYVEHLEIWDSSAIPNNNQTFYSQTSPQERLFRALVLGVKDYIYKCGFNSTILGLSGGIDSSLVATIAVAALGSEKVSGILMPSPWSSIESVEDALELAKRLEIKTRTIPIKDLMQGFDITLTSVIEKKLKSLTSENLQARIRGTLLMAISNQEQHLLLSTGNKSELAMGYCTLYGDMNGGLSVIGDLYKTSVFELCEWLDSENSYNCRKSMGLVCTEELIGLKIRNKPPSAELRPGQLDSDSLPEYDLLDPILKDLIEERLNLPELLKKGYNNHLIERVQSLLKKAEFKRRQAPPLLKVSNQAFGSGWRIPIAAK